MIKILAISGSLRSKSSNTKILQAMGELATNNINISMYNRIGDLPYFNPDMDGENALAIVKDWRTQLNEADGVIFCTPEYAHGVPGVLKNALDWIVSSGEFMHKPTAVISASPSPDGGNKASASLIQTLRVMMAEISEETILSIPGVSTKLNYQGEVTDPDLKQALEVLLHNLVRTVDERQK